MSSVQLATGLALVLFAPALWLRALHTAWPLATGLLGALFLVLFARREGRCTEPLLPAAAVRDRAVRLSNLASVLINLVGFTIPLIVPYYLARIGGFNAATMGLLLALATVGVLASSMAAPRILRAAGQRQTMLFAAALVALAQIMMSYWPMAPAMPVLVPGLMVHGLGIGLFQVAYADHIVASLRAHDRGIAGSLTVLTRVIGVIVAAVLFTSVLQALEARHLAAGLSATSAFHSAFRDVFWGSGLALAGIVALAALRAAFSR